MNGYCKLKIIGTTKSRSMDFESDLLSSFFSENQSKIPETNHHHQLRIKNNPANSNNKNKNSSSNTQDSFSFSGQDEKEDYHQECNNNNIGEKFGGHIKLTRNSSVSSSASSLQSAVKRAFSMRRSSSVSERYCRIHDQSVTLTSPIDDEDGEVFEMGRTRSVKIQKKKNNNKNKILKACKKIFGL